MANAGTVNVKFKAETAAFTAGVSKVTGALGQLGSSLNLIKGLAAGFLAWKGVSYITGMMASIDATAKLADRIGVTTEAMVGLQHAGNLAGVSAESVAKSMEKMSANLANVGKPSVEIVDAMKRLGLSLAQVQSLSPDKQLETIADALLKVSGAGDRAAASQAIFGKGGLELQQLLAGGSKALREAKEEADALGISFSRLDAFKVEQANDALTRVSAVIKGGVTRAAIEVSPIIEAIATKFVESAKAAGGFGKIAMSAMDAIKTGVGISLDAWNVLTAALEAGRVAINMIGLAWAKSADAGWHAVQWITGLWNNWVQLVQDSTALVGKTIAWMWEKTKQPIAAFVTFTGEQMAKMLYTFAAATDRLKGGLANQLRDAAGSISAATGGMSAKAERNADEAAQAMKRSAEDVKASWTNLFNIKTTGNQNLQALADSFRENGSNAAVNFRTAFDAVLSKQGSTSAAQWFADIEAMSTEAAAKSAAAIAARQQADNNALNEKLYNDTMAWANKTWTDLSAGWDKAEKKLQAEKEARYESFYEKDKAAAQANADMWEDGWRGKLAVVNQVFGALVPLMQSRSRKMFEIGKAAAYANTVINTAESAMAAYKAMAGIPYVGPALGAAAAAAAVAAGTMQLSAISGTSFGGGGSVSSAGGSIALAGGEPTGVLAAGAQGAVNPTVNRLEVSISGLSDDAVLSGAMVRRLIEQINEGQRDGSRLDVVAA